MERYFERQAVNTRLPVKYWWLLLLFGIAALIAGIMVFVYPVSSYISLAIVFGFLILASGIFQIIIGASNKNYIAGRGWVLASGIIETILGIILCFNFGISATVLPFFLGFWLLFRSFSLIGIGSDMNALKIPGSIWTIITGILLLLCSILILVQPFTLGVTAVLVWVGVSFVVAGISSFVLAFQLKNLHKKVMNMMN